MGRTMLDTDLPVHPFTGMTALAVLDSGRVVWPVLGGAPEDDDPGEDDDPAGGEPGEDDDPGEGQVEGEQDDDEDDDEDDKPLGPKGERALAAMKEKLKAERAKRRAAEAKLTANSKADDDKP